MRTEIVFFVLFIIGLVFKLLNWPGSGILLILSLGTLSMLYCFGGVYFFSHKGFKNQKIPLSIFAGISLFICLTGILFKLMFWPGAAVMTMVGGFTAVIILAATLAARNTNKEATLNGYFNNLVKRVALVGGLAGILFFMPARVLIKTIYGHDPKLVELKIRAVENPDNEQYQIELYEYMDEQRNGER